MLSFSNDYYGFIFRATPVSYTHLLDVADELGIEVILVSIPVNEMWSEYRGELCDVYYENIRKIATEYELSLIHI